MKERKHGFRVPVPLVLAGLLLAGSWLQPARADAAVAVLEITELWDDGMVYFAVETTYSDIVEFAVGNNDAAGAFIDYGASSPPPSAWWGNIAWQSEGQWYVSGGGIGTRDLNWLENVTDFDNYSFAFFYSSYSSGNYGTPLNPGLTSGFEGTTGGPCSPFAAFDTSAYHHRRDHCHPHSSRRVAAGQRVNRLGRVTEEEKLIANPSHFCIIG